MEAKKLQEEELQQVSGGAPPDVLIKETCRSCGQKYTPSDFDHTREVISNGCWKADTIYYICPYCGYKRKKS